MWTKNDHINRGKYRLNNANFLLHKNKCFSVVHLFEKVAFVKLVTLFPDRHISTDMCTVNHSNSGRKCLHNVITCENLMLNKLTWCFFLSRALFLLSKGMVSHLLYISCYVTRFMVICLLTPHEYVSCILFFLCVSI